MYLCMHTCMYECMHTYILMHIDMYVCRHAYVCQNICMYECIYACMYVCMCTCMCTMSLHIFDMSLNKYGFHIVKMTHTAIMLNGYMDPTFLHKCVKTQPTIITTTHYCHVRASNKYPSQMPYINHICKLVHVQIGHNHICINTSHELNLINNVTTNTVTHTLHIIGICP